MLGLYAVLFTGAGGSQKVPPPGMGEFFVGAVVLGCIKNPCISTADDARMTNVKMPMAVGSRHHGRFETGAGDGSVAVMSGSLAERT